jgi:hypothetical protein
MSNDTTPVSPYPWDEWHARARAAGMQEDAAANGRALMRECCQHAWEQYMGPNISTVCGYDDKGEAMLAFGLAHPELAVHAWDYLIEDDAGNNPRTIEKAQDVSNLLAWVYRNRTWPVEWPCPKEPTSSGMQA